MHNAGGGLDQRSARISKYGGSVLNMELTEQFFEDLSKSMSDMASIANSNATLVKSVQSLFSKMEPVFAKQDEEEAKKKAELEEKEFVEKVKKAMTTIGKDQWIRDEPAKLKKPGHEMDPIGSEFKIVAKAFQKFLKKMEDDGMKFDDECEEEEKKKEEPVEKQLPKQESPAEAAKDELKHLDEKPEKESPREDGKIMMSKEVVESIAKAAVDEFKKGLVKEMGWVGPMQSPKLAAVNPTGEQILKSDSTISSEELEKKMTSLGYRELAEMEERYRRGELKLS